jgi:hypothetical protein
MCKTVKNPQANCIDWKKPISSGKYYTNHTALRIKSNNWCTVTKWVLTKCLIRHGCRRWSCQRGALWNTYMSLLLSSFLAQGRRTMAAEVLEVHVECGSRRGWCCGWRWRCPWWRAWRGGSSSQMRGAGYGWAVAMVACRDPAAALRSSGCSGVQGSGGGRAGIRLQWAKTIRGGVQVATPQPSGKESRGTTGRGLRSLPASSLFSACFFVEADRSIDWVAAGKPRGDPIRYSLPASSLFFCWVREHGTVHEIGPGP